MRASPYTADVEFSRPSGTAMSHLSYNSLTGEVLCITPAVAALLAHGRQGSVRPSDLAAVGEESVNCLLQQGWLIKDEEAFEEQVRCVADAIRSVVRDQGEYGLVPWPRRGGATTPRQALDAVMALAEAEAKPRRRYYFYALGEDDADTLGDLTAPLAKHWDEVPVEENGSRMLILTADPTAGIDWGRWTFLREAEGRVQLPVHPSLIGGPLAGGWIDRMARTVSNAAQIGFLAWVLVYLTEEDPADWLDQALAKLIGTGILYQCARPFSFVAKRSVADWREFLCDLDNLDFDLLQETYREAEGSRRRSLLHVHGGGIVHNADSMVTQRRGLKPALFHCHAIPVGYYVNLDGEIWPCPKMAAGGGAEVGAKPLATYDADGLYPDLKTARRWRGREVTAISACDECVGRFLCAGGCALEAARDHGGDPYHPASQPIEEYMRTVVGTQQRRLTRTFGPRPGMGP